jgi:hypothetical protein
VGVVQGTRVHHEHTTTESGAEVWHVQDLTTSELGVLASFGVGGTLGFEALLPLRLVSGTIEFLDATRRPLELPGGSIHHRDETLVHAADPWLLAHAARAAGPFTVALRGGVTLPLGRTEENPFALGRQGLPHQHLQFGTGTWDPLLGLGVGRRAGRVNLALTGLARLVVGTNRHGYRAGHRFAASLQAERPLGRSWHLLGLADYSHERAETWNGQLEEEGNLGRTDVLLGLGIARSLGTGSLSLLLRVPIVTRAHAAQLDYPLLLSLAWSAGR